MEQVKPAADLKERLDAAENKKNEYFEQIQQLNRELREALGKNLELEKRVFKAEQAPGQKHTKKKQS